MSNHILEGLQNLMAKNPEQVVEIDDGLVSRFMHLKWLEGPKGTLYFQDHTADFGNWCDHWTICFAREGDGSIAKFNIGQNENEPPDHVEIMINVRGPLEKDKDRKDFQGVPRGYGLRAPLTEKVLRLIHDESDPNKKFTFYWLDGQRSVLVGATVAKAYSNAGYHGSPSALVDWYDEGETDTHDWDSDIRQWVCREPILNLSHG